jgi:hypothetical protein
MPIAGSFTGAFAFKSLSDQLIGYQTFNYTGADQLFTVPEGINLITVRMWGAGGGSNRALSGTIEAAEGGPGGFVKFKMLVTPSETLTLKVGGGGGGYYGGGGGGGAGVWGAGGGGGSSYTDPTVYDVVHITGITGNTAPPAIAEVGYQFGIAAGGLNNTNGGNGLIYISW